MKYSHKPTTDEFCGFKVYTSQSRSHNMCTLSSLAIGVGDTGAIKAPTSMLYNVAARQVLSKEVKKPSRNPRTLGMGL